MVDKIVEGRLQKFYEEVCLYEQPFIKENTTIVHDLIKAKIAKLGENISVSRFVRFKVGDMAVIEEIAPKQAALPPRSRLLMAQYQRILLKLSGEVLAGRRPSASIPSGSHSLAAEIAEVARTGVQIGLVVGGGNFFRGVAAAAKNMDRVSADHMGMLATVINALALQDALEKAGRPHPRDDRHPDAPGGRALHPPPGHSPSGKRPHRDLRGRHVQSIFFHRYGRHSAGARNPRRCDRQRHARGRRIRQGPAALTRTPCCTPKSPICEVLAKALAVMDASAVAMCRDNQLPIRGFQSQRVRQYNAYVDGRAHRNDHSLDIMQLERHDMKNEPRNPAARPFRASRKSRPTPRPGWRKCSRTCSTTWREFARAALQ